MEKLNQVVFLIEQGKFLEAIKFIDESKDDSLLIYKAISLLGLSKVEEAIKYIEDNEKILLKHEPAKLIMLHSSIYIELEDFVKAMEVIAHYEELPYISQEVEETFISQKEEIRKAQKAKLEKKDKKFSLLDTKNTLLTSDDNEKIMIALEEAINKKNIKKTLDVIKEFLLRDISKELYYLKSYALGLLSEVGINEELDFLTKFDGEVRINPTKLVPPYDTKEGQELLSLLDKLSNNDTTIYKNAVTLFNEYYVIKIPVDIFKEDKVIDLAYAFIGLAKKYMSIDNEPSENTLKLMTKIESIIN